MFANTSKIGAGLAFAAGLLAMRASEIVNRAWDAGLKPPPDLTVWQWAEENRILGSSSPVPGPYRTDKTPYLRQIMECLSPSSSTREIDFMKGSQVGGTEASINWIGFIVSEGMGNTLIVLPDQKAAKEWSQQRLEQLTDTTPCLRGKISDANRRNSKNSTFSKRFGGGQFLKFAWASSPSTMKSTPAANLIADEVDEFVGDAKGQGDPIAMLRRRFTNFERGKFLRVSTPTAERGSRIERGFNEGDQRYYFLPCPDCGYFQRLVSDQIDFKGNGHGAAYRCLSCETLIEERFKSQMLAAGRWLATAGRPSLMKDGFPASSLPGLAPAFAAMLSERHATFHLSAYYSPLGWYSWSDAARDWRQAKGDTKALKVQVNQTMGETWQERGDAPDWKKLFDRHADYQLGTVQDGALLLTAGADVQPDRIEVQVIGRGRRKQRWLVDYLIIYGDTSRTEVWQDLTKILGTVYQNARGNEFTIKKLAIDSGFASQQVYAWARQQRYGPVSVIKGGPASMSAIVAPPSPVEVTLGGKRLEGGVKVSLVNVSELKKQFYGWLHLELPNLEKGEQYPDGFFHFCATPDTEEYCKQLTAEQLITRTHRGYQKREWEKVRPRNEALDTCIYAIAAEVMLSIDRYQDHHWDRLEQSLGIKKATPAAPQTSEIAPAALPPARRTREVRWRFNG